MKAFDFYEFTGVLVPGVITLYGVSRLFPDSTHLFAQGSLSVGDLGVFAVLAYAGGHLVQAFGNLLETGFWKLSGGMPSGWVRNPKRTFLSAEQTAALQDRVAALFPGKSSTPLGERNAKEWFAITRQIYAAVLAAGRAQRIDTFNGNYGMFRGISAGLLVCLFLLPFSASRNWLVAGVCATLAALALARMRRFGVHYARELFIQFLQLNKDRSES